MLVNEYFNLPAGDQPWSWSLSLAISAPRSNWPPLRADVASPIEVNLK
jgi:hypothetical protein